MIKNIGELFGIPKGTLSPTVGVSFGLPNKGGKYGGYQVNPVGTGGAVNPYYDSAEGLSVGAVDVNPLVSFQATSNDDGKLVAKPLINLHLTPNGCGIFGCEIDQIYHNRKASTGSGPGVLDLLFGKKGKKPQPNYDNSYQQYPDQQYQYPDQQYQPQYPQQKQGYPQQQQYPQQHEQNYSPPPPPPRHQQQYTPDYSDGFVPSPQFGSNRKEFGPQLPFGGDRGHHHDHGHNGNVNRFVVNTNDGSSSGSGTKKVKFGGHSNVGSPSLGVVKHEHHHYHHHDHKHQKHGSGAGGSIYYDDVYKRTNQLKRDGDGLLEQPAVVGTSEVMPINEARGEQEKKAKKEAEAGGAFRFPKSGRSLDLDEGEEDKTKATTRRRRSADHGPVQDGTEAGIAPVRETIAASNSGHN